MWKEGRHLIGLEIEMEGKHLKFPTTWEITDDGSLRGNGVEYRLRSPIAMMNVKKWITSLQFDAYNAGAQFIPSKRCGVHVHINCQEMTEQEVFNFICLYLTFETVLTHWCGKNREGNMFCLRSSDAEYLIETLSACQSKGNLLLFNNTDNYRYASIRISSLFEYGTLEFRTMPTPTNLMKIDTWAKILYRLKEESYQFKNPIEIVECISGQGYKQFVKKIMKSYAHRFNYVLLEQMMLDDIRRVQDIAYTEKHDLIQKQRRVNHNRFQNIARVALEEEENAENF